MKLILNQDKRKYKPLLNSNDQLLYHHSTQCHVSLQCFLDRNPIYWCFVPQLIIHVKEDNEHYHRWKKMRTNDDSTTKSGLFDAVTVDLVRTQNEVEQLIRSLPEPPSGYEFSIRQRQEQFHFFQKKKEYQLYSSDLVHLYHYSMIAVCMFTCVFLPIIV